MWVLPVRGVPSGKGRNVRSSVVRRVMGSGVQTVQYRCRGRSAG